MKRRYIIILSVIIIAIFATVGIRWNANNGKGIVIESTTKLHKPVNSVYYWKTVYNPTMKEKEFLREHHVVRIYLRMFDVVPDDVVGFIPNATISFGQHPSKNMEIVPTVFVTVEAMEHAIEAGKIDDLAEKIVKRVSAICSYNDINNWHELQLDCDWTSSTREGFFQLCSAVKTQLKDEMLLSCTIRLHQLQQEAPPVDYGVLMVYNVESFESPRCDNSILNSKTVKEFLSQELVCKLPLDIALPTFQWNLQFDEKGKFQRILYNYERPDSACTIRHEEVPYSEISEVQNILSEYLHIKDGEHSTILYHLDETNLKNYTDEEFEDIYKH